MTLAALALTEPVIGLWAYGEQQRSVCWRSPVESRVDELGSALTKGADGDPPVAFDLL